MEIIEKILITIIVIASCFYLNYYFEFIAYKSDFDGDDEVKYRGLLAGCAKIDFSEYNKEFFEKKSRKDKICKIFSIIVLISFLILIFMHKGTDQDKYIKYFSYYMLVKYAIKSFHWWDYSNQLEKRYKRLRHIDEEK